MKRIEFKNYTSSGYVIVDKTHVEKIRLFLLDLGYSDRDIKVL